MNTVCTSASTVGVYTYIRLYTYTKRYYNIVLVYIMYANPSDRAVSGVGLQPFACWDSGFESRRGHGCLCLVSVVCCQVEVSATGWSLIQRSTTECGESNWTWSGSLDKGETLAHMGAVAPRKLCIRKRKKRLCQDHKINTLITQCTL
jgi:hypothetical protein